MTDSTEAIPDIIRDLLHPTTELRRNALRKLKENWQKEFREYLWKAIESEKTRSLQSQFVELAVDKLEDHGLRKMIRFVENNHLYDGSRRIFIEAYCSYEDEPVREALIKSLKRPRSQTFEFVGKLLTSREFVNNFGQSWVERQPETNRLDHQREFFTTIMTDDIPLHARKEFAAAAFWMNLRGRKYYLNLIWLWEQHIRTDPDIHRHILGLFFPNDLIHLNRTANITNISDEDLLWTEWTNFRRLYTTEAEDSLLITSHPIVLLSLMVIHSVNSTDPEVRELAMNILSKQQLDLTQFISFRSVEDFQAFMACWNEIFDEGLEDYLIEYFLRQSYLPEPFRRYTDSSAKNQRIHDITNNYQIAYSELAEIAFLCKPRQIFYHLIDNDPDENNRALAYSYLKNQKFWMIHYPIGPQSIWIETFRKTIRSMRFETSNHLITRVKELIYFLIDNLERNEEFGDYKNFTHELKDQLSDQSTSTFVSDIDHLRGDETNKPVVLKLRNFLFDEPLIIDETLSISPEDQILIQLLDKIEDRTNLFSILNLFEGTDDDTRLFIVNYYYKRLEEDPDFALNKTLERHLQLLLEQARDDTYIRVRTTAQLLASNGRIDLLPNLLRELTDDHLQNLIELVELNHTSTNQTIFGALVSRLRHRRGRDDNQLLEELIRLGQDSDDMLITQSATKCAELVGLSE